jgi:hypothetical protein
MIMIRRFRGLDLTIFEHLHRRFVSIGEAFGVKTLKFKLWCVNVTDCRH